MERRDEQWGGELEKVRRKNIQEGKRRKREKRGGRKKNGKQVKGKMEERLEEGC